MGERSGLWCRRHEHERHGANALRTRNAADQPTAAAAIELPPATRRSTSQISFENRTFEPSSKKEFREVRPDDASYAIQFRMSNSNCRMFRSPQKKPEQQIAQSSMTLLRQFTVPSHQLIQHGHYHGEHMAHAVVTALSAGHPAANFSCSRSSEVVLDPVDEGALPATQEVFVRLFTGSVLSSLFARPGRRLPRHRTDPI